MSALQRNKLFETDSSSEDESNRDPPEEIATIFITNPNDRSPKARGIGRKDARPSTATKPHGQTDYNNLASNYTSQQHASAAEKVDSSIYDYDAVYESLHSQPKKIAKGKEARYMKGLLLSAEVRKRDQLQAKEKLLAREREAEGEEYAGKEKFVTGAYKAQQEEVRRLAEEERKREEEEAERVRKMGGGMAGLYKGILEREDDRHAAIAKAIQDGLVAEPEVLADGKSMEQQSLAHKSVTVNEDGQVVDKRQLLKAGLNVIPRPQALDNGEKSKQSHRFVQSSVTGLHSRRDKATMRERQTRMLEAQLEQVTKRAADDEQVGQEALQRAAKSQKTKAQISSARERYLQRKKDAEAAKTLSQDA